MLDPTARNRIPGEPSASGDDHDPLLEELRQKRAVARFSTVLLGVVLAVGATYAVPALAPLRPWIPGRGYVPFWNLLGRELLGEQEVDPEPPRLVPPPAEAPAAPLAPTAPASARAVASAENPVFPPYQNELATPPQAARIQNPEALEHYFETLTRVELRAPGAVARAGQWGDSVLGLDGITSHIRQTLQARFGDAGHGFHLLDRYNPSYHHQGIEFEPGGGWSRCLVVQECNKRDHHYGYGGLLVRSGGGASATFGTAPRGFGAVASHFELWFARQTSGGRFEVKVDDGAPRFVSTRGPELEDGWFELDVPPGAHRFQVRAAGGGEVRGYGVVLENDGPGVVWDAMALIGGSTRGLRTIDPEHVASQLRHRKLDLIVFMFGGNDLERNYVDLKTSMEPYYAEYGEVLAHFRAGRPGASCLIMSPSDHGKRAVDGTIVSRPFVKTLVAAQREIARRNHCAFFDTYAATGGEGTAARWYRARPRLLSPDLGHPTTFGHALIAQLFTDALLYEYGAYRARMSGHPLVVAQGD